ncbi:MAG: C-type lectin domain-containing protein [Candidatus Cloacimonetes bacterium]|nr:C-type lectin domain-containing protein [Candidatus Cloacimonadota bacterium]
MRNILITISMIIVALLAGCDQLIESKSVNSIEFHPVIEHLTPFDGSGYTAGSNIEFSSQLYTMESDITSWYLEWISNIDGILHSHYMDEDGISTFSTSLLSNCEHNISIIASNPDADETIEKSFSIYNDLPEYIDYDDYSFLGKFENSMYFTSEIITSWSGADSLCTANQGHLVSITTIEESNYIKSKLSQTDGHLWIGLYYDVSCDSLRWVTNEEFYFENFGFEFEPYDDIPFVYIDCRYDTWSAAGFYSKQFILEIEQ